MKLTLTRRNMIPTAQFGLSGQRKYPVSDAAHAANAKARATQQVARGNLTAAQKAEIDKKANRVLGKGKA